MRMTTERYREYNRDRRAKAVAKGKCGMCATRWPIGDKRTCDDCLRQVAESKARRKQAA